MTIAVGKPSKINGKNPLDTSGFQRVDGGRALVKGKIMPKNTQEDDSSLPKMKPSNDNQSPAERSYLNSKASGGLKGAIASKMYGKLKVAR